MSERELEPCLFCGTGEVTCADSLNAMRGMPEDSIDAIVTDPPYGLGFMGREWDHAVPGAPYWSEALRVAKPGAHLLCFGGTRTFHRMTCAIEDAGWEIRDCIMWVYGSGFPKSMDVGKAIDKALGAKRKKVPNPLARKQTASIGTNAYGDYKCNEIITPEPVTDQAKQWDGWGTCLKPAWEPIIVARKPLDGTVAHNVLKWGVGALNIDACRVPSEPHDSSRDGEASAQKSYRDSGSTDFANRPGPRGGDQRGRFPANLVHDGSRAVLDLFPESKGQLADRKAQAKPSVNVYGDYGVDSAFPRRGDSGSAARYFYCAKASRKERGEGNDHPCVKPLALMGWLVRLVTPEDAIVLDPFCGSGTTLVAAKRLGRKFIGVDREQRYCEIALHRLEEVEAS